MNTHSQISAWFMDTISMHAGYSVPGVVTGKPIAIGGTVGRTEATGRGVAIVAREAAAHLGLPMEGAKVVVQGFGNVGYYAAQFFQGMGCRVVAVSDSTGGTFSGDGLDLDRVKEIKSSTGSCQGTPGTTSLSNEELLELTCDILVPAAMEGQIGEHNAQRIDCKIVVEGANGPTTPEGEAVLVDRGITVVPDILANAGGLAVSYVEWVQELPYSFWTQEEVDSRLTLFLVPCCH